MKSSIGTDAPPNDATFRIPHHTAECYGEPIAPVFHLTSEDNSMF